METIRNTSEESKPKKTKNILMLEALSTKE